MDYTIDRWQDNNAKEGREFLGKEPIEDEFMDKVYTNAGTIALEDTSFDPFIETPEAAKAAGEHYLKK